MAATFQEAPEDAAAQAQALWRGGDTDGALRQIEEAERHWPGDPGLSATRLGILLSSRERWPQGLEYLRSLGLEEGTVPYPLMLKAARSKTFLPAPYAMAFWDRARRADPDMLEAYIARLRLAFRHRFSDVIGPAALELEEAVLRLSPASASASASSEVWCMIGDGHVIAERLEQAAGCYARARELAPNTMRPLVGMAVVALDRLDRTAAFELLSEALSLVDDKAPPSLPVVLAHAKRAWAAATDSGRPSVEVVVFTHVHRVEKLKINPHLGAPGTRMIERTISSLRDSLQIGPDTPITVYMDRRDAPLNDEYVEALRRYCSANGLGLVVNEAFGLRRQWLDAIDRAKADLVMLVEHDFEFLSTCPALDKLADLFASRPDVQYLRLGKRRLIIKGGDQILLQTSQDRQQGITKTRGFSNNPHLERLSFLSEVTAFLIREQGTKAGSDSHNSGAGGVEANVLQAIGQVEKYLGLPAALRLFGTHAWGHPGSAQQIVHLGV